MNTSGRAELRIAEIVDFTESAVAILRPPGIP